MADVLEVQWSASYNSVLSLYSAPRAAAEAYEATCFEKLDDKKKSTVVQKDDVFEVSPK